jgi:uncharacterized protein (TIGR02421 family)
MKDSSLKSVEMESIKHDLASGAPVVRELAGGGRLNIERPQPFLCLYRRPSTMDDVGTEDLLTTQASYLVIPEDEPGLEELRGLLSTILGSLSASFGSVLLLEIWSGGAGEPDAETGLLPARLMLHAANRNAPVKTLEIFDRSLVSSDWPEGCRPEIDIVYEERTGSAEMPRALTRVQADEIGVIPVGLEISPFYRSPISGKLLPQILLEVRKILGVSMKRAFNTFIDTHANYTPGHYHELGPRQLEDIDLEVDKALARIDDDVDLILNVTPVNTAQAWNRFRRTKFTEAPEFHYRALPLDPAKMKRKLFAIPVDSVEDPALHHIFATKREELDRQISMLMDRTTGNFLLESQQVYGCPDEQLVATARRILEAVPPHTRDDRVSDVADAKAFARHAQSEIDYYKTLDPSLSSGVDIRSDIPGLMVSHGRLIVGEGAKVAQHRIEATLQHEIGTHLLTYHNGGCQPLKLLQVGLAGYEELQEGMAVLSEFMVGGLSRPRFRQLASRVEAVDQLVQGAEFSEVFRSLHDEYGFSQRVAYNTTMRVFRGGGFTKDAVYLRGLISVLDYLEQGGTLETLFIGKIALQHIEIARELVWRQILEPPRLLPKYLDAGQAKARMQEIECSNSSAIEFVLESLS